MEKDNTQPEPDPSGNRRPPRPPNRTAVGLGPEGDDSDKGRRFTITKVADGEGRFIRTAAGRDHYGHVIVRIEPNRRDKGIVISSNAPGDIIPAGSHDHSASDKKQFVVTGWTSRMKMDDQTVLDWTGRMCDVRHEHDCEFDGWGTNPKQP